MQKRLIATRESDSGRNTAFRDTRTGEAFTRAQLVRQIKAGNYDDYHTRVINGIATPVSNPDKSRNNNLG